MNRLAKTILALVLMGLFVQLAPASDASLPKQVEDAIQNWLDSEWGEGAASFTPSKSPRLMRDWSEQTIRIDGEDLPRGLVVAQVEVFKDGRRIRRIPVSLRVQVETVVPVAARALPKGETLYKDMIRWEKREVSGIRGDWPDPDDVITDGETWTRRSIKAGDVITLSALENKPDVLRGDIVTLIAHKGNVSVETQGIAIEEGFRGDVIRVENPQYNRILRAEVLDRSTALIQNVER